MRVSPSSFAAAFMVLLLVVQLMTQLLLPLLRGGQQGQRVDPAVLMSAAVCRVQTRSARDGVVLVKPELSIGVEAARRR